MNVVIVESPLSVDDEGAIEQMLRDADPFVSPRNIDGDMYTIAPYLLNAAVGGLTLNALLDNNILTRATALASGESVAERSDSARVDRLAAAVMCFLIAASFRVEPNISLHEKAAHGGHDEAVEQLRLLRIADHVSAQAYCDVALGRTQRLPAEAIAEAIGRLPADMPPARQPDFAAQTPGWRAAYYILLKAVSLYRQDTTPAEKAHAFLTWSRTDAFFSVGATTFGLMFLSPPRPAMIKRVNSDDPAAVKRGIENAAWDLVYLKHWKDQVSASAADSIWFVCTNDQLLKRIARLMIAPDAESAAQARLSMLGDHWRNQAAAIAHHYEMESAATMTPDRNEVVAGRYAALAEGIANLERELGL